MKSFERVRRRLAVPAVVVALLLGLAGIVAAVAGSLPGGSNIEVQITSPASGAVVPEGPVTVTGTASVGEGVPVANTLLIYVIDLSGSTAAPVTGDACGSQNIDGTSNRILDCELAAAKALNAEANNLGTVFEVGVVGFGGTTTSSLGSLADAFSLDLSPAEGIQNLIAPDANAGGDPEPDFEEALFGVRPNGIIERFTAANVGANTNYWAAVERTKQLASLSTAANKVVVFLSDGLSNRGGPSGQNVDAALAGISGITFHSFAIGNNAACSPSTGNRGTLQQIADATGGTCTELDDPQDAIEVLPAVIASTLTDVSIAVDGGSASPAMTTPATPLTGPANATWEFTTGVLTPGSHEICATANGSDGGGAGSVSDCVTVHVDAAPLVTAAADAGAEGSAIGVSASITDDGSPSIAWTYTLGAGVDAGATCAFADPGAASTTIQCTDDGAFMVTATVSDGINPAVEASAALTVTNANPTVDITSPAAGATFAVAAPVALTSATSDPGTNDVVACSINWGDGVVEPGCGGTHAFAAGTYTIMVTASDGDGGTAVDSVTIHVNNAPSCASVAASPSALWPPNNKFVPVTLGGGSDPDGDAITLVVTGVSQDEPRSAGGDAGLAGGNVVNLRASRLGSGDGRVYEVAFTITDAHGATCSASTIVGVPHNQGGGPAVDSVVRFPSIP